MLSLFLILMFSSLVHAQEVLSFEDLLSKVQHASKLQAAALSSEKAQEASLSRSQNHFWPHLYLSSQAFQTNDAASVFFNHLGQRQIQANDFSLDPLNHPGQHRFALVTLGLDWPLYNGSMNANEKRMNQALLDASRFEKQSAKTDDVKNLLLQYSLIWLHEKDLQELKEFQINLEKIISSYQVGLKSNPIGYMGLLGLKGLTQHLESMILSFELKAKNAMSWIGTKANLASPWTIERNMDLASFLNERLGLESNQQHSSKLLAHEKQAQSLKHVQSMQKARHLPKLGLFANNQVYLGQRDTSNSQTFGAYLMWDLLNSDSFKKHSQAGYEYQARSLMLKHYQEQESMALNDLKKAKQTLEQTMEVLKKSDDVLLEQTRMSMKLFRSGMLGALDLSQVLASRMDFIENENKVYSQYIDVCVNMYQLTH